MMPKKTKRPAKATTKPAAEVPAWVNENPPEIDYVLHAFHEAECDGCRPCSEIELTRAEFIALKDHLAELRGYVVPKSV
jgi:hypothetical protein